jgi:hypothetical protein
MWTTSRTLAQGRLCSSSDALFLPHCLDFGMAQFTYALMSCESDPAMIGYLGHPVARQ